MTQTRLVATTAATAALALVGMAAPAGAVPDRPHTYTVSTDPGVLPESIHLAPDGTFYVTSLGTGDVYRGHVGQPTVQVVSDGTTTDRASAVGVEVDAGGRVFVAGVRALDVLSPDGDLLARRALPAEAGTAAYLNDAVVTHDAVYVTDSGTGTVWRAALDGNSVGELEAWFDARVLYPGFPVQYFFLNGIAASPDGKTLLVSSQGLEALVRIDVATASGDLVDVPGSFGPDGLHVVGDLVYGVLNYAAPAGQGVYVARLAPDWRSGEVVARVVSPEFQTPTAVAVDGDRLLVVNSQLDTRPGTAPYTVVAVDNPLR